MSDRRTLSQVLRADQHRAAWALVVVGILALTSALVPQLLTGPREDRLDEAIAELVEAEATMRERQLAVRTFVIAGDGDVLTLERSLRDEHDAHLTAAETLLTGAGVPGVMAPVRAAVTRWEDDVVAPLSQGLPFPIAVAEERFVEHDRALTDAVETAVEGRDDVRRQETVVVWVLTGLTVAVLVLAGVDFTRRRRRLERQVVAPLERLVVASGRVGDGLADVDPDDVALEDLRVLAVALLTLDEAVRERERLQELARRSDERLRLAHDLSDIGFVVTTADGTVREANAAVARLLGRRPDEVVASPVSSLVEPDDLVALAAAARAVTDEGRDAAEVEVRLATADASLRWALVTVSASRDGTGAVTQLMAQVHDVTDRRLAQEDQERYRRELERSNAELEQFAYVASHDLSEPLRVMAGFAELLPYDLGDDLTPETERHLRFILDAAARMQRLIDDLLAYSRVGRVDAPVDVVDVGTVARDVVALVQDDLADTPVTFRVEALPRVLAAPSHVRHLVLNLVANAVKFRAADRPPVVRIGTGPVADGFVAIEVDDNGIGIEAKYRERIFRMFQRLHSRDDYPGTGMGLAICRKITDLYGGSLDVEDSPLGGSRFVLRLPVAPATTDDRTDGAG